MPTLRKIVTRIAWVAALGALTTGLSLGAAGAASASIGRMYPHLNLTTINNPTGPNYHDASVGVTGYVAMTRSEAQNLLNTGHKVVFRIWGADPGSDDFISGPYWMGAWASDRGLEFFKHQKVYGLSLDEDGWGFGHGCLEKDEIYVGVRLLNSAGGTVRKAESNEVGGYDWGCNWM